MNVSDDPRDSSSSKAVREKLHVATCISEPLPRVTYHPGDLYRLIFDRDGRLHEADSSFALPDDDVVEPLLGPVGRPAERLDCIQPFEAEILKRCPHWTAALSSETRGHERQIHG